MKLYKKTLISLVMISLWGCGSGDDNEATVPEQPVSETTTPQQINEAWKYIETPFFELKGTELQGQVELAIGRLNNLTTQYVGQGLLLQAQGDNSYDTNGDGVINYRDAAEADVVNVESGITYIQQLQPMIDYLATNPDGLGAGTARPDIFKPGYYSVFDLLRYVVGTRDDMRFEGDILSYKDSELDTYEFTISWDSNGDGIFDANDGKNYNSPHWHFAVTQSMGINGQDAVINGEMAYFNMDQFWLKDEQLIRFLPFVEEMTNRRKWNMRQGKERLAANDGKFIIPMVTHIDGFIGQFDVITQNIEVKAHNLRSDVFQDGVITEMDAWLSVAEKTGADVRFSWWPIMSSGAKVNHFFMMHDPWAVSVPAEYGGWRAAIPQSGEYASTNDFSYTPPTCDFNRDGSSPATGLDPIDPQICKEEWQSFNGIGGFLLNDVYDATILTYPPEYIGLASIQYFGNNSVEVDLKSGAVMEMYVAENELQHTVLNNLGDFDLYPTPDVTGTATLRYFPSATQDTVVGNAPILNEQHFGWKIADCTECHNDEKNPLGHGGQNWPTNSTDGFDYAQPYYCSSCHGNNGAPDGHNRGARCFWCHNTNNGDGILMKHHGDASLAKFIPKEKNVSNLRHASTANVDNEVNFELYDDLWDASHNSDYTLSKKFPDPYACATCHGLNHDIKEK